MRQAVGTPVGGENRLRHGAGRRLELQRHAVGIPQHRHVLPLVGIDVLHRPVQRLQFRLLELRGGLPGREFGFVENLVGRLAAEPRERGGEKLPQAAGVAVAGEFHECIERDLLRGGSATIGQRRLDHERIAAIDPRRPGGGREEFARHHLPDAGQEALLADRHDAVGGRRRNLDVLDRLEECIGLTPAKFARGDAGGELRDVADLLRRAVRHAGERLREELCECEFRMLLQHRHEATEFDAIGMRLDLLRLRRQVVGGPLQNPLRSIRPLEVKAGMGVGDCRLLEIFLDAAAAALELRLHLDRHAGAVLDRVALVVLGNPLDRVLLHQLRAALAGGDVNAFSLAVQDLGLVGLRVDPQFGIVGRVLGIDLRDDLHRLAGREHAIHSRGGDADALLTSAHPQPVKLGAVEQLAEDQRDLFADDAGAVVLHAHAIPAA